MDLNNKGFVRPELQILSFKEVHMPCIFLKSLKCNIGKTLVMTIL